MHRNAKLAFGSAILTLLAVGALSYRAMVVSSDSEQWVQHSHQVLENLEELLFAMESVESAANGFAATGDLTRLGLYHSDVVNLQAREATLRSLTRDNAAQQARLPMLETLAAEKVQYTDKVIDLRGSKGAEAAAAAIQEGQGQRLMSRFQAAAGDIEQEELRLLAQRNERARSRLDQTRMALLLGTLLGLLITAAAAWSAHRESGRRNGRRWPAG